MTIDRALAFLSKTKPMRQKRDRYRQRDELQHAIIPHLPANDRDAVAAALERLPENERAAIISEFWHGQRGEAKTRAAALRHLRHPSISKELSRFLE